jgi:hypothetical protein
MALPSNEEKRHENIEVKRTLYHKANNENEGKSKREDKSM